MKTKIYTTLFLVLGTAVITFLIIHFLTPGVIKESFIRWGNLRALDMTLSDLVAVMLIAYVLISMLKYKKQ